MSHSSCFDPRAALPWAAPPPGCSAEVSHTPARGPKILPGKRREGRRGKPPHGRAVPRRCHQNRICRGGGNPSSCQPPWADQPPPRPAPSPRGRARAGTKSGVNLRAQPAGGQAEGGEAPRELRAPPLGRSRTASSLLEPGPDLARAREAERVAGELGKRVRGLVERAPCVQPKGDLRPSVSRQRGGLCPPAGQPLSAAPRESDCRQTRHPSSPSVITNT